MDIKGIHHITMIAGDAQRNVDFYAGTLGMRLVKISVNQDDPGTYHLFYADGAGSPGSDLTFFPYPGGRAARRGAGVVNEITLAVPAGARAFWEERLQKEGVEWTSAADALDEEGLSFSDPDGLALRIVERNEPPKPGWTDMLVPAEAAIQRSIGVQITTNQGRTDDLHSPSAAFLEAVFGWPIAAEHERTQRYLAEDGSYIDLTSLPEAPRGHGGHGGVHHVAFRVATPDIQEQVHDRLFELGAPVSPVIDRSWFKSIYFREPGGVLYEVATDGPGFTLDEPLESLGTKIALPPWMEETRELIERNLPKLVVPGPARTR